VLGGADDVPERDAALSAVQSRVELILELLAARRA
jgi:hypothetical protein